MLLVVLDDPFDRGWEARKYLKITRLINYYTLFDPNV